MTTHSKSSLLERKKEQWAREREEMSQLYLPWNQEGRRNNYRNQFASSVELHRAFDFQDNEPQKQTSPSLPPVNNTNAKPSNKPKNFYADVVPKSVENNNYYENNYKDGFDPKKRFSFYEEDGEGDTSGYGSETFHNRQKLASKESIAAWQRSSVVTKDYLDNQRASIESNHWNSLYAAEEETRPKWGDRGVAVGKFWEPQEPPARLPQTKHQTKGPPVWLERGLNMLENSSDILVIDQSSTNSGGIECDRSSYTGSDGGRNTFLRGQNVPVEPEIKAQRENKRIKALEVQSVLINQLEEREKRKKEEKERALKEEQLEELRLRRQAEEEKFRAEEEKRRNEEKKEQERKKLEALQKAVAEAEATARQEKLNRWNSNKSNNISTIDNKSSWTNKLENEKNENHDKNVTIQDVGDWVKSNNEHSITKNVIINKVNDAKVINIEKGSSVSSPRNTENTNILPSGKIQNNITENSMSFVPLNVTTDNVMAPFVHSGVHLALLVPQASTTLYGIAQPLSLQSLTSLREASESISEEKIITPSKYRNQSTRDTATQTDLESLVNTEEKYSSSRKNTGNESNYELRIKNHEEDNIPESNRTIILRKDRRLRSEERYSNKNIENRPKWGVNVPAAQYKKQSEKDPFYAQRRKTRQRQRVSNKQYSSSDDSRSPSPPTNSNENDNSKIRSRLSLSQTYWRNKRSNNFFRPSYLNVERVIIKPIEYNNVTEKELNSGNKSPGKRLTLSQKFINDKYGNRKLCSDDSDIVKNNALVDINLKRNAMKRASMPDIQSRISNNKSDYEYII